MIGSALLGPAIVVALIRLTSPLAIPLGGAVTRLGKLTGLSGMGIPFTPFTLPLVTTQAPYFILSSAWIMAKPSRCCMFRK